MGSLRTQRARHTHWVGSPVGDIGEVPHQSGIEERAQSFMHGLQLEIDKLVFKIGNAAAIEPIGEPVPGLFSGGMELMPIEEDVALVGVKIEGEAAIEQIAGPAQILETGNGVAPGNYRAVVAAQSETIGQAALTKLARALVGIG